MNLGIMQPYLFPYLGYFQLIHATDRFVIHDDVQFIKGGWINRNRILVAGDSQYFTMPLKKASSYDNINQRCFSDSFSKDVQTVLRKIQSFYHKAPYFSQVFPIIEEAMNYHDSNVSAFTVHSLQVICRYLGLNTDFYLTSDMNIPSDLHGQDRVIWINKFMGSSCYINPTGGVELYNCDDFMKHSIDLKFIKMDDIAYQQFDNKFVPALSIVDVLMFNTLEQMSVLLNQFQLYN